MSRKVLPSNGFVFRMIYIYTKFFGAAIQFGEQQQSRIFISSNET